MRLISFVLFRCFGFLLLVVPLVLFSAQQGVDSRNERSELFDRSGVELPARVISKKKQNASLFERPALPHYLLLISYKDLDNQTVEIEVGRRDFQAAYEGKVLLTRVLQGRDLSVEYPIGSLSRHAPAPMTGLGLAVRLASFVSLVVAAMFGAAAYARFMGEIRYVYFDKEETRRKADGRIYWRGEARSVRGATGRIPKAERSRIHEMEESEPMCMYRLPGLGMLWWEHELPFKTEKPARKRWDTQ